MKAILINGYTTDLADQIGIYSYPGKHVVHLVLPEEGLRITPFRGQLIVSEDIDRIVENYEEYSATYTGQEIEIDEGFVIDIRRFLHLKSQLESQLAGIGIEAATAP